MGVRLAVRLADLRTEHGWSLDELARRSGVSRSTLSRLERCEVSPTATLLGRLCTVYGRTMSAAHGEVEAEPPPWCPRPGRRSRRDEAAGFVRGRSRRRIPGCAPSVVESVLEPGASIAYANAPVPGVEQHIWVLEGTVEVTVAEVAHTVRTGDCLRFRLHGPSRFHCAGPGRARYALLIVLP